MPIKEDLILPIGFALEPDRETYVRLGKVKTVSLISREMVVQFIDGDHEEGIPLEVPITALLIVGSDDPVTTYTPSAAVYARGDMVNILIIDQQHYAISVADMYTHSNRENFALVKGWSFLEVLNGLVMDILDDGANSFLEFWCPNTHAATRIEGDPSKRNVMRRMLDYFKCYGQNTMDIAHVDDGGYPYEKLNGGPGTGPHRRIYGMAYAGKGVNGFDYVEDGLFASADYSANLVAYHSTLIDLPVASMHPGLAPTLEIYFESASVVWFGEEDPEYILAIASFPAWETAPYLKFVEIPVNSLAGRKFLERDENEDIVLSWQLYSECVREIHTINRSYIDWTAHGGDWMHSERLARALLVYTTEPVNGTCNFGFIDGYGYDQSGNIYEPVKLTKVEGSITRTTIDPDLVAHSNGSRFNYDVSHNDPVAAGYVDNWYVSTVAHFNDNAGTRYSDSTNNDPTKDFPMFTDGENTLSKRIDFNYHVDGYYQQFVWGDPGSESIVWNNGLDGFVEYASYVLNEVWQSVYHNDTLLFTDYFKLRKESDWIYANQTYTFFHAVDADYGLFVCERIITALDGEDGPSYDCTGTTKRQGLVIFGGVEYIIWELTRTHTTFPALWNFFPWLHDANHPDPPETAPYDFVDNNYDGIFWWSPYYDYHMTPNTGYAPKAWSYPGSSDGVNSKLFLSVRDSTDELKPSDYLQVSVDREADSFIVRFPCFLWDGEPDKTISYPSIGDTIFRFNGGALHFNKPAVTQIIVL